MRARKHTQTGSGCAGSCCLQVSDLTLRAGETEILSRVGFHLHCGEIVALIGPNGAGKSSLLRAILGQMAFEGSISFETAGGGRTRPLIGYVPQSPNFDRGDPVSVCDLFCTSISRWPVCLPTPAPLRQRIRSCLERTRAAALLDKRVGDLSGGELQRVLLALALEPLPHILILDEPLSGVDVEGERQLLTMLDEICSTYDLSILLTTHDFATLHDYVDRVILLDRRVWRTGSPSEVLSSPEFRTIFHMDLGGTGL